MRSQNKSSDRDDEQPLKPAELALITAIAAYIVGALGPTAGAQLAFPTLSMTVEQAEAATSLSRSLLYLDIRDGILRAIKVRSCTRILIWDLIEYLRSRPPVVPK